jgi:Flp pilus assembly protein TadD
VYFGGYCFAYIVLKNKTLYRTFVPILESRNNAPGLTLCSPKHFLEFINQYLLVSPVLFVLAIFLFIKSFKKIFKDKISLFLFLVAISQMGFHFVIFSEIGYARDWDLFASCGLGLTILGIYLFLNLVKTSSKFKYCVSLILVSSFFFTLPWILVNASKEKSIKRFKVLLAYEPKSGYSGHFVLLKYLEEHGFNEELKEEYNLYVQLYPEVQLTLDAVEMWNQGKFQQAINNLRKAIEINPDFWNAYSNLGLYLVQLNQFDEAEPILKKAIRLGVYNIGPRLNLSVLYLTRKDYKSAIKTLKEIEKLAPQEFQIHRNLFSAYGLKGDIANCIKEGEIAVKLNYQDARMHLDLGTVYYRNRNWEKAVREFKTFLSVTRDTVNVDYANKLIQELEVKGYK